MYSRIVEKQKHNKSNYKNTPVSTNDILSIQIKNNTIISAKWTKIHPTRKDQYIRMVNDIISKFIIKDGYININVEDHPVNGYFNFCKLKGSCNGFLIPFCRFADNGFLISNDPSKTLTSHDDIIRYFQMQNESISFKDKIPKVFANGILGYGKRLEFVRYALRNLDVCDFYAHNHPAHKFGGCISTQEIQQVLSLGKGGSVHQPFEIHNQYKYVLYVDGNALADRTRLLLMCNSVPIILKSKWEEFYTDLLVPYENFIPCDNVSDIRSIVEHLEKEPEQSMCIIKNNERFVKEKFRYKDILQYAADLINALL
jgi:hypothetical protein